MIANMRFKFVYAFTYCFNYTCYKQVIKLSLFVYKLLGYIVDKFYVLDFITPLWYMFVLQRS